MNNQQQHSDCKTANKQASLFANKKLSLDGAGKANLSGLFAKYRNDPPQCDLRPRYLRNEEITGLCTYVPAAVYILSTAILILTRIRQRKNKRSSYMNTTEIYYKT